MTGNDSIRIGKVLKEFNIGMGTLVDFLHKKGINIDSNPGAKLTGDQYAIVAKEFKKEQIVKAESKKVAIKVKDITDKEPKSIEEPPVKELFVKTSVEEKKGPKVLYKIDLDKPSKPVVKQDTKVEKQPEAKPETKIELKPEQPVSKPVEKTPDNPKVEQKTVPPAAEPQKETVQKPVQQPAQQSQEVFKPSQGQKPAINLVIVDKIDLPVEPKKKGDEKRKRLMHKKNEKVDVAKESKQNNGGKPASGNHNNQNKNQGGSNANKQHQNNKNHNNNGKVNKKDKFKPVKVEVDEDAVQKQIKETYQRMVEGKGKTKGSKYRKEKREQNIQRMMEEEELQR